MTTETPPATSTSPKKRSAAKKKRKISKHILQANKDHEALGKARGTDPLPASTPTVDPSPVGKTTSSSSSSSKPKKSKGDANSHVKDVKEAAGYLSNWKQYRQQWKFNKNTQSWLIRHMYESDKVAKGSFGILLEYLGGLQGKGAKDRILQYATRRALRYKKYSERDNDNSKANDKDEESSKQVQFSEDTKAAEDGASKTKKSKKASSDASEEEARWNALGDHDKRKEYKRARKVLETLREPAAKKD